MTEENNSRNSPTAGDRQEIQAENVLTGEPMKNEVWTPEEAIESVGMGMFQVKLVIFSGIVWMARGFDSVIYRHISGLQTCDWKLRRWEGSLLMTITTLFKIIGCFIYGIWSDNYGRRTALTSSLIFLFVFGAVSAGLPTYTWFLVIRAAVGFGAGGLVQSLVLCCECMPSKTRGRAIYTLSCFWALGVVLMLSILFATHNATGTWRIFVAVGALPPFTAMVLMRFFPESYRFLMVSDHYIEANEILVEMAESNKKTQKILPLYPLPAQRHRGRISEIKGRYMVYLLIFLFMGLATSFCFRGLNILTTDLIPDAEQHFSFNAINLNFMGNNSAPIPCISGMTTEEFILMIWTHASDFPGFVIYILLVDLIDRKILLGISYLLSAGFTFLHFIPPSSPVMSAVLLYCARTLLVSQFDLLLLMTAEIFPTTHRGTIVGMQTASFHLGEFLSLYIISAVMSLKLHARLYTFLLLGFLPLLTALASLFVKPETRGKELRDFFKKK